MWTFIRLIFLPLKALLSCRHQIMYQNLEREHYNLTNELLYMSKKGECKKTLVTLCYSKEKNTTPLGVSTTQ